MSKRPESLETVLLAIELLRRIPRRSKITAAELHEQLKNVGIVRELRTIQRQLEMLSAHFEIDRDDRNKPYGYRWLDNSSGFALHNLTAQESLLLGLAEEHLKNLLPAKLMKSMDGFFAQARRNLNPAINEKKEREWQLKVRVVATTQPLLPPKIVAGVFEVVSDALYSNNWLHLDYCNANGKRAKVEVMPLGLAQQGHRLYLVCRYRNYDNERSLALHRIISAQALAEEFVRPPEFNLKKFDDDGRFGFGDGKQIQLTFRIDKNSGLHLTESPLSTDQVVTELNEEQLKITATVVDTAMLDRWLRGFGDAVSHVKRIPVGKAIS